MRTRANFSSPCRKRRSKRMADWLNENGYEAVAYHAGMDRDLRARNQDRFLQEDGVIVAATVAFGMGIERITMLKHGIADLRPFYEGDIRWLAHYASSPLTPASLHEGV